MCKAKEKSFSLPEKLMVIDNFGCLMREFILKDREEAKKNPEHKEHLMFNQDLYMHVVRPLELLVSHYWNGMENIPKGYKPILEQLKEVNKEEEMNPNELV